MFPVPPDLCTYVDINAQRNQKYKALLLAEYRVIKSIQDKIRKNAKTLYNLKIKEGEYQKKKEQEKNLQSAQRMARLDALTGIRNKNAFSEYSGLLNSKIQNLRDGIRFGIVMCDVNDLKKINDIFRSNVKIFNGQTVLGGAPYV